MVGEIRGEDNQMAFNKEPIHYSLASLDLLFYATRIKKYRWIVIDFLRTEIDYRETVSRRKPTKFMCEFRFLLLVHA